MDGLIVKDPWSRKIIDGSKSWEIRGSDTKHRGTHYIIESKTGLILGTVDITDSFGISWSTIITTSYLHQIPSEQWSVIPYKNNFAWVLKNPIIFTKPIRYKHPQGAVIWVKNVETLIIYE